MRVKLCQLLDQNNNQVSLKWNQGENANSTVKKITRYGELAAIKALL